MPVAESALTNLPQTSLASMSKMKRYKKLSRVESEVAAKKNSNTALYKFQIQKL